MSNLTVVLKKSDGQEQRTDVKTGAPVLVKVPAGSQIHLELNGQKVDGSQKWGGKTMRLVQMGKMLVVEAGSDVVVELENYYLQPEVSLYGAHWDVSEAKGLQFTQEGLQLTPEVLAEAQTADSGAAVGLLVPVVTTGSATAGAAAAAVAGSAAVASGSSTAGTVGAKDKSYQAVLTLGPVTDGGVGTKVVLYKADGNKLGEMSYNAATKAFEYIDKSGYSGVVIAVAIDTDAAPDYISEATGARASIGDATELMAVAVIGAAETAVKLNITSATTLAGNRLGVVINADGSVQSVGQATDVTQVSSVNASVATALGLGSVDLVRSAPVTTINEDASGNMASSNAYGKVLAAMAGMAEINGSIDASMSKLASGFASADALNATLKAALVQGALVSEGQTSTQTGLSTAVQSLINADISKVLMPANLTIQVKENIPSTTVIGKAMALDEAQSGVKYYLAGGLDDGKFSLNSSTGELKFWDSTNRNYEALSVNGSQPTYQIKVRATDAANNSKIQAITIKLQDVNEFAVSDITNVASNPTLKVKEGEVAGTQVGLQAFAKDADGTNNTITYSLAKDANASADYTDGEFVIDASTGVVSTAKPLDYEAGASRTIYIKASSADASTKVKSYTVGLIDVDDTAPVITNASPVAVNENVNKVVQLTAQDPDTPNTGQISYAITGGADKALFEVVNGELRFVTAPDFESPKDSKKSNKYEVEVTASDGVNKAAKLFAINVNDVLEAGPVLTVASNLVAASDQTAVTTLTSSSGKTGLLPSYSIAGGADAAMFSINGDKLVFKSAPDFLKPSDAGADNVYEVNIKVSDATGSNITATKVTVADLTAPVLKTASVNNGDIVLTYSDKSGLSSNSFPPQSAYSVLVDGKAVSVIAVTIDSSTSQVTLDLLNPIVPGQTVVLSYNGSLTGTALVQDASGNLAPSIAAMTVSNTAQTFNLVFDQATVSLGTTEGAASTSVIYQARAKSSTGGAVNGVTYSLQGADAQYFQIDAASGAIKAKTALDFENTKDANADNTYQLQVKASYGNSSSTQDVQIKVGDITEMPSEITSTTYVPKATSSGGLTLNDALASLLSNDNSNASWAEMVNGVRPANSAVTVTYSFMNLGQLAGTGNGAGKPIDDQFSQQDKDLLRNTLKSISDYCNITFVETTSQDPLVANMRLFMGSSKLLLSPGDNSTAAFATQPVASNNYTAANLGDVYMVREKSSDFYGALTFGQTALIHEIGHALGLDHPFQIGGNNFQYYSSATTTLNHLGKSTGGGYDTPLTDSAVNETIMAYNQNGNAMGLEFGHYDVAALQHLYGANLKTNVTDTTYKYTGKVADTIWDGGGTDTIVQGSRDNAVIDLRSGFHTSKLGDTMGFYDYSTTSLGLGSKLVGFQTSIGFTEDLGDGKFRWWYDPTDVKQTVQVKITTQSSGAASDDFFSTAYSSEAYNGNFNQFLGTKTFEEVAKINIAEGVTIENATGNIGDDVFYGNDAPNVLIGNDGNDKFYTTGLGADTLSLGAGKDEVHYNVLKDLNMDTILDFKSGEDKLFFDKLGLSQSSLKYDSAAKILTVTDAGSNIYSLNFGVNSNFDLTKDVVFSI